MLIFLTGLIISANSQTKTEMEHLKKLDKPSFHQHDYSQIKNNVKNEYQFLSSRLFLFYKYFISSQDASQCSFTPSCSVYAARAINKQGAAIGLINFFDRFTRCNNLSPELYPRHPETKLLYDPVE